MALNKFLDYGNHAGGSVATHTVLTIDTTALGENKSGNFLAQLVYGTGNGAYSGAGELRFSWNRTTGNVTVNEETEVLRGSATVTSLAAVASGTNILIQAAASAAEVTELDVMVEGVYQ